MKTQIGHYFYDLCRSVNCEFTCLVSKRVGMVRDHVNVSQIATSGCVPLKNLSGFFKFPYLFLSHGFLVRRHRQMKIRMRTIKLCTVTQNIYSLCSQIFVVHEAYSLQVCRMTFYIGLFLTCLISV
jgi:hypothetical protein